MVSEQIVESGKTEAYHIIHFCSAVYVIYWVLILLTSPLKPSAYFSVTKWYLSRCLDAFLYCTSWSHIGTFRPYQTKTDGDIVHKKGKWFGLTYCMRDLKSSLQWLWRLQSSVMSHCQNMLYHNTGDINHHVLV